MMKPMIGLDKRCPLGRAANGNYDFCMGRSCAWYTDGGCAIAVLAQNKQQKLQGASCGDVFELPIQPKGAN